MAKDEEIEKRIMNIIEFGIVNEALKIPDEAIEKIFDDEDYTDFKEWNRDDSDHQKILIAAERKGAAISNCFSILSRYEAVSEYISNFESKFGKDMWTRIGVPLTWETYKNNFDYELFAIICAVNGILGTKDTFKKITLQRIQSAMNGYKKHDIYEEIKQSGILPKNNLSKINNRTLYRRLEKLSEMNFFRRYTYKNRHTYYSTTIDSNKELVKTVCKFKSKRMKERKAIYKIEKAHGLRE
ncbi:hypothetical protein E3V36_07185 [Candidatus Marinimicrobia bacterium MT.SAG.2]|nr:hypothetical protein E3V36_07185 [Candidatus Marinimicrobia bacterium MT.SAG.2]